MKRCQSALVIYFLVMVSCSSNDKANKTPDFVFSRSENPIYQSPLGLAADPSVVIENDTMFMYYTALDGIAVTFSLDNGISWNRPNNSLDDYIALERQMEAWDNSLETVEVLKVGNTYKMYYSGYREGESDNIYVENYEIGMAVSTDGINFARIPESMEQPILARNATDDNAYDRHAMTSPGVVYHNGIYYMIYAGWNVSNDWTGANSGIRILGATSNDGTNWEKMENPILTPPDIAFSPDVNEASLIRIDDGLWLIPFSTDKSIGIARSASFTGNPAKKPALRIEAFVEAPRR